MAEDIVSAAASVSAIATNCANCHMASEVNLQFGYDQEPSEWQDLETHMQRHQWGVDRLWEGLIAPSDASWSRGIRMLAEAPLEGTETAWDENGVWQNSYLSGPSSRPSTEFKIDGSYFFNAGNSSHELKFGGRLRNFETQSTFHWPGRDLFTVDGGFWAGLDQPTIAVVARRGEDSAPVSQDYTSL